MEELTEIECPICGNSNLKFVPENDEYFAHLICPSCESEFMSVSGKLELCIDDDDDDDFNDNIYLFNEY